MREYVFAVLKKKRKKEKRNTKKEKRRRRPLRRRLKTEGFQSLEDFEILKTIEVEEEEEELLQLVAEAKTEKKC